MRLAASSLKALKLRRQNRASVSATRFPAYPARGEMTCCRSSSLPFDTSRARPVDDDAIRRFVATAAEGTPVIDLAARTGSRKSRKISPNSRGVRPSGC